MTLDFFKQIISKKFSLAERVITSSGQTRVVPNIYEISHVKRGKKSSLVGYAVTDDNARVQFVNVVARNPRVNAEYDKYFKTLLLLYR